MSADRKSRFLYQDVKSRGSSHGGLADLLRVTQLIHQLFHVASTFITNQHSSAVSDWMRLFPLLCPSVSVSISVSMSSARQFQSTKNSKLTSSVVRSLRYFENRIYKWHGEHKQGHSLDANPSSRVTFFANSSFRVCFFLVFHCFIVLSLESRGRILQLEIIACSFTIEREEPAAFEVCWLRDVSVLRMYVHVYFFPFFHFFFFFFTFLPFRSKFGLCT